MEPLKENIDGSKEVVHSVEHRINWGYVAAAVAAVVVVLAVRDLRDDRNTAPGGSV